MSRTIRCCSESSKFTATSERHCTQVHKLLPPGPALVYRPLVPRVHLLPDTLINQIAAGEVVERPASVVKELVENALDAGASSIVVLLEAGGRDLVQVADDGDGMGADDAALALERHATSKIAALDDLAALASLGFRGEALPSIAAASRLVLETAAAPGAGTRVEVAFGRRLPVTPCARPRGTTVAVSDLFLELPARRKFLRAESTELRHAVGILAALAFTRPGVAFSLAHSGRTVLDLPPAPDASRRLPDLVGVDRARMAVPVEHATGPVRVGGFLLPARGTREVVIAVNGRAVRDRLLVGTVNRALTGASGRPEADAWLAIELPPDGVDVNVHPTKAEVRFAEPGRVLQALTAALAQARSAAHQPVAVRRVVAVPSGAPAQQSMPWAGAPAAYRVPTFGPPLVGEAQPGAATAEPQPETPLGRYVGQYRETYLVLEDAEGLLLVDQHVAHERVLYERLLAAPDRTAVQRLLVPEVVELSAAGAALAAELAPELQRLGVEIEPASGHTVRVLGVPASLGGPPAGRLVAQLLADLGGGSVPGDTVRERVAASLACQAAIKKNRALSRAEAERLLRELAVTDERHRCPHGRPILLRLPHAEIERRIGRK
jgi:DNA mismatch repair protein MutL